MNKKNKKRLQTYWLLQRKKINRGIVEESIVELREMLNKYPNNERILCSLMYALYVACEDEELCKVYDSEIISMAYRIMLYSKNSDSRNEARRILFRHYCDTNRKAEALQIAKDMAPIETSLERNIYWALQGDAKISYLKERMADDLHYLLWDIRAYIQYASISTTEKECLNEVSQNIKKIMKENLNIE